MSDPAPSPVLLSVDADTRVATITIDRPKRRNALNTAVLKALVGHLESVRPNRDVGVVVLTGAGDKAFCAGGDLSSMPSGTGILGLHDEREHFVRALRAMAELGKPILARVNGAAMGGGFGLMLACDLVVAADDVKLGTPEIKVGLFPMMIMALIVRNVGRKKAMELMLTGDRIAANEAERIGLINRAVPRHQLDEAVDDLARRIAGYSPAILKLGRDSFYRMEDMSLWNALDYLRSQLSLNTLTADAAEGVMAFLAKREPEWKGE